MMDAGTDTLVLLGTMIVYICGAIIFFERGVWRRRSHRYLARLAT